MKKKLVLSLGSNLGNRYVYLAFAKREITEAFQTTITSAQCYETPPWGEENQSNFLNTAVALEVDLPIYSILAKLQQIENNLGKVKIKKWGPRSIDLDILFYGSEIISDPLLNVPHPHLHTRAFVLAPLVDILPEFIHPTLGLSITELLSQIPNDTNLFSAILV